MPKPDKRALATLPMASAMGWNFSITVASTIPTPEANEDRALPIEEIAEQMADPIDETTLQIAEKKPMTLTPEKWWLRCV
jgi:hypothetical protein